MFSNKIFCRYHKAVQGLREESRLLQATQMSLTGQYDQRRGIVTDLLHLLVTSEEPAHYIKSFEHLTTWVDSSLDQYKASGHLYLLVKEQSRAECGIKAYAGHDSAWHAPLHTPWATLACPQYNAY